MTYWISRSIITINSRKHTICKKPSNRYAEIMSIMTFTVCLRLSMRINIQMNLKPWLFTRIVHPSMRHNLPRILHGMQPWKRILIVNTSFIISISRMNTYSTIQNRSYSPRSMKPIYNTNYNSVEAPFPSKLCWMSFRKTPVKLLSICSTSSIITK